MIVVAVILPGLIISAYSRTYKVKKNDTLIGIAKKFDTSAVALAKFNGLKDQDQIYPGQNLRLEKASGGAAGSSDVVGSYTTVRVRPGETLSDIALRYRITVDHLVRMNRLASKDIIHVGQKIRVPVTARSSIGRGIIVQKNDTLSGLAIAYRVRLKDLLDYNRLNSKDTIYVGQRLKLPGARAASTTVPGLSSSFQKKLDSIRVRAGQWRYVIIHHSATDKGTVAGMDTWHRRRGMENGLAYHFVIGNGRGMKNGEIAIGNRWRKQLHGGHVDTAAKNRVSIGICLVGNFQKRPPSKQQIRSLNALVAYLNKTCRLNSKAVATHRMVNRKGTLCPGRHFPAKTFLAALKM